MLQSPFDDAARQQQLLAELVDAHAEIAGDIVQVGRSRWAIYGSIAVDGHVLVAEYDSPDEAHEVLLHLGPDPDRVPSRPNDPDRAPSSHPAPPASR